MSAALIVKKIRLAAGLQQGEFASELKCGAATVSHWERGTRTPRLPFIRKMVAFAKERKIKVKLEDFVLE